MKPDERANFMRIAMNVIEIPINMESAETICLLYEALKANNGNVTIRDLIKIKINTSAKYEGLSNLDNYPELLKKEEENPQ